MVVVGGTSLPPGGKPFPGPGRHPPPPPSLAAAPTRGGAEAAQADWTRRLGYAWLSLMHDHLGMEILSIPRRDLVGLSRDIDVGPRPCCVGTGAWSSWLSRGGKSFLGLWFSYHGSMGIRKAAREEKEIKAQEGKREQTDRTGRDVKPQGWITAYTGYSRVVHGPQVRPGLQVRLGTTAKLSSGRRGGTPKTRGRRQCRPLPPPRRCSSTRPRRHTMPFPRHGEQSLALPPHTQCSPVPLRRPHARHTQQTALGPPLPPGPLKASRGRDASRRPRHGHGGKRTGPDWLCLAERSTLRGRVLRPPILGASMSATHTPPLKGKCKGGTPLTENSLAAAGSSRALWRLKFNVFFLLKTQDVHSSRCLLPAQQR